MQHLPMIPGAHSDPFDSAHRQAGPGLFHPSQPMIYRIRPDSSMSQPHQQHPLPSGGNLIHQSSQATNDTTKRSPSNAVLLGENSKSSLKQEPAVHPLQQDISNKDSPTVICNESNIVSSNESVVNFTINTTEEIDMAVYSNIANESNSHIKVSNLEQIISESKETIVSDGNINNLNVEKEIIAPVHGSEFSENVPPVNKLDDYKNEKTDNDHQKEVKGEYLEVMNVVYQQESSSIELDNQTTDMLAYKLPILVKSHSEINTVSDSESSRITETEKIISDSICIQSGDLVFQEKVDQINSGKLKCCIAYVRFSLNEFYLYTW